MFACQDGLCELPQLRMSPAHVHHLCVVGTGHYGHGNAPGVQILHESVGSGDVIIAHVPFVFIKLPDDFILAL